MAVPVGVRLGHRAVVGVLVVIVVQPSKVQDSRIAPAKMDPAPRISFRLAFSQKTSQAITMVARPSRLSSSDPEDAVVRESQPGPIGPLQRSFGAG
ncbi:hypothetical protein JP75_19125 [Devosia riboflavina]|uniref:Uncharacterized protein n=1 Tax=Devosia riboflavina TaxID=46914 RepID=A0A087LYL4_9HYPH|nr:hypothetical protein JP75_19125 [Devosia riboflavina]